MCWLKCNQSTLKQFCMSYLNVSLFCELIYSTSVFACVQALFFFVPFHSNSLGEWQAVKSNKNAKHGKRTLEEWKKERNKQTKRKFISTSDHSTLASFFHCYCCGICWCSCWKYTFSMGWHSFYHLCICIYTYKHNSPNYLLKLPFYNKHSPFVAIFCIKQKCWKSFGNRIWRVKICTNLCDYGFFSVCNVHNKKTHFIAFIILFLSLSRSISRHAVWAWVWTTFSFVCSWVRLPMGSALSINYL